MKKPIRERVRAIAPELIGLAVLGILMATVVEALSPENLLRQEGVVSASAADFVEPRIRRLNRPA